MEMEQPQGEPAPVEEPQPEGGGFEEAAQAAEGSLTALAEGIAQDPGVPDEIKQGFVALREQFGSLMEALMGGGEPQPEPASQPMSPEQGASGAQPLPQG